MYVTLLSNDSTNIFKNTPNTFTNLLKQPLNLNEKWEVGLSYISFSLQDLTKKSNQNKIKRSVEKPSLDASKPKKAKLSNDEQDIIKNKFKKLLNSTVQNDKTKFVLDSDSSKIPDKMKTNIDNTQQTTFLKDKKDSKNSNNATIMESTKDQDEPILTLTNSFLENSLNRLVDNISEYFQKIISSEINDIIFIYTDIIKPRPVGNKKTKCLKIFSISSLNNYIHFNRVEYYPIENFNINDISIMIRNDEGRRLNLIDSIPVYCTLHFKKI